jgi:hypothetical protein
MTSHRLAVVVTTIITDLISIATKWLYRLTNCLITPFGYSNKNSRAAADVSFISIFTGPFPVNRA